MKKQLHKNLFGTTALLAAIASTSLLVGGCASSATSAKGHDGHSHGVSVDGAVTKADVLAAQKAWGEGIVDISRVHAAGGDYEERARTHIDTLYAYGVTDVMFKPTLASEDQYRETFDEALSYFIGTDGTEDKGFAISGWTDVRWDSNGIHTDGDSAVAMGNYFFDKADGSETKVEYTFHYVKDDNGDLLINVHHSSLPFSPQ